ncbi:DUF4188 domain-containing protein [Arthrobacter sp. NicSoilC12]|uniref:DUF4188 domain-containing protein n=1 Tax=Arthrobacter sp. NicSoilC12 TaxID=2831001 RepID=UPI001CC66DF3|nr:DUF4188 domain-containing protein [Arthrobacter sp. NicSoilC12]GIU56147.1 hypothetical protein NicSoilC12_18960 [Arthrobacter sp. NicSoilC12]
MARINAGRFTHRHSGDLVVFLIGMRINSPWRPDLWLPVFLAMPRMLTELFKEPGSGLLGCRFALGAGGPVIVQYWDSLDKLYAYASAPESEHRPAWTAFNRQARKAPRAVGIWHETFQVSRAESMYVSMPTEGLAQATELVPVGSGSHHAKDRLSNPG